MADDVTSDGKIYTFYLTKMDCFIALAMDVCSMHERVIPVKVRYKEL